MRFCWMRKTCQTEKEATATRGLLVAVHDPCSEPSVLLIQASLGPHLTDQLSPWSQNSASIASYDGICYCALALPAMGPLFPYYRIEVYSCSPLGDSTRILCTKIQTAALFNWRLTSEHVPFFCLLSFPLAKEYQNPVGG